MLLFEYDAGHLYAARLGTTPSREVDPEVMDAVRDSVLEIVGRPLFPVQWQGSEGTHAAPAEPHRLVAMDPSGQVVSVEVLGALDSVSLVAALARSGRTAGLGWVDLAAMYPRGAGAFRRDWNAFRESLPPRPIPGPRLYVVTGAIHHDVRPALEMLADSGVEVYEVAQRESTDGRTFVEITEPFRVTIPTVSAVAALSAGHRPDLVAVGDEQVQRVLTAIPDGGAPVGPEGAPRVSDGGAPVGPDGAPRVSGRRAAQASAAEEARASETPGHAEPASQAAPEPVPAAPAPEHQPEAASEPAPAEENGAPAGFESALEPDPGLAELADAIGEPTELVWEQLRKGIRTTAVLREDGLIELPDGRRFSDPSSAAEAASQRHAVEGWRVWRLTDEGPSLEEAMEELRAPNG